MEKYKEWSNECSVCGKKGAIFQSKYLTICKDCSDIVTNRKTIMYERFKDTDPFLLSLLKNYRYERWIDWKECLACGACLEHDKVHKNLMKAYQNWSGV